VRVVARDRLGRPIAQLRVRARGSKVRQEARTDGRGVARFTLSPARVGLVLFSAGARMSTARTSTCRTLLGVTRAQGTRVTG
jgi:hypothetical protein